MNIELLQYLQTKTDLQVEIEEKCLSIHVYEIDRINSTFNFQWKEIDNLISQLDIKLFMIYYDMQINENTLDLLEKIKKYPVYVHAYFNKLKPVSEKFPNIKFGERPKVSRRIKLDVKILEILSKYNELKVDISYEKSSTYGSEKHEFKIMGNNKDREISFTLMLPDISLLQTMNYESFNITGSAELHFLSKSCNKEIRTEEKEQLCEKCQARYAEIIQKYNSLFELIRGIKTKKRTLRFFTDEFQNQNLTEVDEIYIRDFSKENKKTVELVTKLGFKGKVYFLQ